MSKIDNGGQAFPCLERGGNGLDLTDGGMTIRDYFAAKALTGMLSDSAGINEETGNKFSVPDDADLIAHCCFEMADAMLRARKEGGAS